MAIWPMSRKLAEVPCAREDDDRRQQDREVHERHPAHRRPEREIEGSPEQRDRQDQHRDQHEERLAGARVVVVLRIRADLRQAFQQPIAEARIGLTQRTRRRYWERFVLRRHDALDAVDPLDRPRPAPRLRAELLRACRSSPGRPCHAAAALPRARTSPAAAVVSACSRAPRTVSASGRKRRPASRPRVTSTRSAKASAGSAIQSGSSIHSPTSCARRNSSGTQMTRTSTPAVYRQASSNSPCGNALVRRVERATDLALAELDHPGAEVADVDELRRSLGRAARAPAPRRHARSGAANT